MGDVTQRIEPAAQTRMRRLHVIVLVAVVVVLGLAGTLAVTAAVDRAQQRLAGRLMDQHANEVQRAVISEASRYDDTLADVAASIAAQSDFTGDDFTEITSQLSRARLPGATGIGFVVSAEVDQMAGVQARWRARGAAGLTLNTMGTAEERMFSIFSRPLDGSTAVPGRELSQAPEAAEALRMARASRDVSASQTYVLIRDRALPDAEQQKSFLLSVPVFGGLGTPDRGIFRGWVVMGMRGGDFMQETLQFQSRDVVSVILTDLSTTPPTVVAQPQDWTPSGAGVLVRQRSVFVGQRPWQLRLEPVGALLERTDRQMPALTLGFGILLTLLVAALAGILASARDRARDQVDRATAALRDDIERREAVEVRLREREDDLRHLARHDSLTGLANRFLFHERTEHAIATHKRSTNTLAVIFIDLDGFKRINDTLGHGAGDSVLVEVGARLGQCVRDGDTVGRLGGDEFAVLAEQVGTVEDVAVVAGRIIQALAQPFDINGRAHHIAASAGVALGDRDATAETIIRQADEAMYAAKSAGKGRYVLASSLEPAPAGNSSGA
jgi:diguanylate cyclase (GGDEF)-like protein